MKVFDLTKMETIWMKTVRAARLSNVDLLPVEASADVSAARSAIVARRRTTLDVYEEFKSRLTEKGIPVPSQSAFFRWASKLTSKREQPSRQALKMEVGRLLAAALRSVADELDEQAEGDLA